MKAQPAQIENEWDTHAAGNDASESRHCRHQEQNPTPRDETAAEEKTAAEERADAEQQHQGA